MTSNQQNEPTMDKNDDYETESDYEEEEQEDKTDELLMKTVDEVFERLEALGVRCEKDWECCMTCGHSAMEGVENYVFYHDQDADHIKEGSKEVVLCHNLTEEKFKEVEAAKVPNLVVVPEELCMRFLISPYEENRKQWVKMAMERLDRLTKTGSIKVAE